MSPKETEIKKALDERSKRITSRVNALTKEMASIASPESILGHPLVATGGALAAGIVVGLVVGGLGRRHAPQSDVLRVVDTHLANALADHDRLKQPPAGMAVASQLAGRLLPVALEWGLSLLAHRKPKPSSAD